MFTVKNRPVTTGQFLFFVIGNLIALPLVFWLLCLVGTAITGDNTGGYAFAIFVGAMGTVIHLE